MQELDEAVDFLKEMQEDHTISKTVKAKLGVIIQELEKSADVSLVINRGLSLIEEIANDMNIPPFLRTQLYNVAGILESIDTQVEKS
ncbi:MAG: UPF0147 family protein [Candidatus Woesearchaeota archaeon]|nr:MAG: UPF0147 family protein [Candidatus Woesearchaeota archaeon]